MKYSVFDTDKMKDYLQMECYTKSPEVFELTHVPMRFQMRFKESQVFDHVSEEELLALICKGNIGVRELRGELSDAPDDFPNSQIIIIRGYTGTGKTELCRYIERSFRSGSYFQKQISKVPILTREKIDRYHELRRRTICRRIEKGHLSALGALSIPLAFQAGNQTVSIDKKIEKVSEHIKRSFFDLLKIRLESEPIYWMKQIPHVQELLSDGELFTEKLSKNIDRHVAHLKEIEEKQDDELSKLMLITNDDLNQMGIRTKPAEIDIINSKLVEQLQAGLMYVGGISNALKNFIEDSNKNGMHPIIIMDDLSLVNRGNLREIFDAITGIASSNVKFTIVIGMTTGVYRDEVDNINNDTLRPRINEIDLSEKEGKITEWLDDYIEQFVGAYLSILRKEENPVVFGSDLFKDTRLYPFNSNFIDRLVRFLPETPLGFTPRGTISLLYNILFSDLSAHISADEFIKHNYSSYNPLGQVTESIRTKWEDLIIACYWYGRVYGNYYEILKSDLQNLEFNIDTIIDPSFVFQRNALRIQLEYAIDIPGPGPGPEPGPGRDDLDLREDLLSLDQWFDGSKLETKTERNLAKVLIASIVSVNGGDLRELPSSSPYRFVYTEGSGVKLFFTRQENDRENALFFTPPSVDSFNPLTLSLSNDDYRTLIYDNHRNNKISSTVIERNYWLFIDLINNYQEILYNRLEENIGSPVKKLLASLLLFLDSIEENKFIEKEGYDEQLREIITKEYENTQIKVIQDLYKGCILSRESIIDIDKFEYSIPKNKKEIYDTILKCNVNRISNRYSIKTPNEKPTTLIAFLNVIYKRYIKVINTKINYRQELENLKNIQKNIEKIDKNLRTTLSDALKFFEQVGRNGAIAKSVTFRYHRDKCEALISKYPDKETMSEINESINHNLSQENITPNTEEGYIWMNNLNIIKGSGINNYIKDIERLLDELEKDAKSMPEITKEYDEIQLIEKIMEDT